jgi:hypothetical protein
MIKINKDIKSTETININIPLSIPSSEVDIDKLFMTKSYASIVTETIKNLSDKSGEVVLQISDIDKQMAFGKDESGNDDVDNIVFTIKSIGYDNTIILTGSKIGSYLQDSYSFDFTPINNKISEYSGVPYKIGSIYDMDIYVDPNQRWTEDKIIVIDNDIDINLELESIDPIYHFTNPLIPAYKIKYGYKLPNSTIIYLYHSNRSPNYGKYLSHIRDKRINDILS